MELADNPSNVPNHFKDKFECAEDIKQLIIECIYSNTNVRIDCDDSTC